MLPLEFQPGESASSLCLTGHEVYQLVGSGAALSPRGTLTVRAVPERGASTEFSVRVRIDTPEELTAYRHGGILPYVLRRLASE